MPVSSVRRSQWLNIAGAAAVLRADAISLSGRVPATLGGWYGAIAKYSGAGFGTVVTLSGKRGKSASVYGQPGGTSGNVIGTTPAGSAYLSPWTVTVSGTTW